MLPLVLDTRFDQVHFSDASLRVVRRDGDRLVLELTDVVVLPTHPQNPGNGPLELARCEVTFPTLRAEAARGFDSETDTWSSLDVPALPMSVAEVTVDDDGSWHLTGFEPQGLWVDWRLTPGAPVTLSGDPRD